jgi:hypothetical protein
LESPKINPKSCHIFRGRKIDCQNTTSTTQNTTTSPPKHHVKTPDFSKTPSKNAQSLRQKKYSTPLPSRAPATVPIIPKTRL